METKTWSRREIRDMRVRDIVEKAMSGQITWADAERILGYSARHVRRLRARCLMDGPESLRDRRAGRLMPKRVSHEVVREILRLRKERYSAFNLRHFHDMLTDRHGISASYTYVKKLLQTTGLAEKASARGRHRRRRDRRPLVGMMLHLDGSSHAWLGPERGKRDLIYVLDDANGEALYGKLVPEEDTRSCLRALQHVVGMKGLFSELYVDRGSHFVHTVKADEGPDEGRTQFERVLRLLKVRPIYAHSPQARGRSERAFGTVQGRLPQELQEAGIYDWPEANRYLRERFIPHFNRKFTVEPLSPDSAFIPSAGLDLRRTFALEHPVTIGNDNCARWHNRIFQVPAHPQRYSFARCRATLVEYLDGAFDLEYGSLTIGHFGFPPKHPAPARPRGASPSLPFLPPPTPSPLYLGGHL
jgi:hypothetical protein